LFTCGDGTQVGWSGIFGRTLAVYPHFGLSRLRGSYFGRVIGGLVFGFDYFRASNGDTFFYFALVVFLNADCFGGSSCPALITHSCQKLLSTGGFDVSSKLIPYSPTRKLSQCPLRYASKFGIFSPSTYFSCLYTFRVISSSGILLPVFGFRLNPVSTGEIPPILTKLSLTRFSYSSESIFGNIVSLSLKPYAFPILPSLVSNFPYYFSRSLQV
jgi:hypothetical protein